MTGHYSKKSQMSSKRIVWRYVKQSLRRVTGRSVKRLKPGSFVIKTALPDSNAVAAWSASGVLSPECGLAIPPHIAKGGSLRESVALHGRETTRGTKRLASGRPPEWA